MNRDLSSDERQHLTTEIYNEIYRLFRLKYDEMCVDNIVIPYDMVSVYNTIYTFGSAQLKANLISLYPVLAEAIDKIHYSESLKSWAFGGGVAAIIANKAIIDMLDCVYRSKRRKKKN